MTTVDITKFALDECAELAHIKCISQHFRIIRILIYIQQDATLHSLFYLETALHVSGGTTTHHQGRKQLYLQRQVAVTV